VYVYAGEKDPAGANKKEGRDCAEPEKERREGGKTVERGGQETGEEEERVRVTSQWGGAGGAEKGNRLHVIGECACDVPCDVPCISSNYIKMNIHLGMDASMYCMQRVYT